MRLIFIGPPGSGKGTQAKLLGKRQGLLHFATGDVLRQAIEQDTPEGKLAKPFISAGRLVPDDVVNQIVSARFRGPNRPERFVLDGYPRTLSQALAFDSLLKDIGLDLTAVVLLQVDDEEIVRRLSDRWTCPKPTCQATFQTNSKPPKTQGICDACQTPLYQREDDKPSTIRARLRVFHDLHDAILKHYSAMNRVVEVPGQGDIETIYENILRGLKQKVST